MRRVLSRSLWHKLAVTVGTIVGLVLPYEVGMFDTSDPARQGTAAGTRYLFTATAYCKGTTTTSGVGVRTGIAASDPAILPVGSVINITTGDTKYSGVYTVMDTGPNVQGRLVDLYMWSCNEALVFGRQPIELTVLRLGWNPSASTPSLIDRLFRRRETTRTRVPAPPPVAPDTGASGVNGDDGGDGAKGVNGDDGGDGGDGAKGANSAGTSPAPSAPVAPSGPIAPSAPVAPLTPVVPIAPLTPLAPGGV